MSPSQKTGGLPGAHYTDGEVGSGVGPDESDLRSTVTNGQDTDEILTGGL